MNIGPWEIPEKELLETALRLERAQNISPEDVGPVNKAEQTVSIYGSDGFPYSVSLVSWQCEACKHLLRLALELGLPLGIPVFDPISATEYNVEEDIDRLTKRWQAGQLTTDALSKCTSALRSSAAKAKRPRSRPKKK